MNRQMHNTYNLYVNKCSLQSFLKAMHVLLQIKKPECRQTVTVIIAQTIMIFTQKRKYADEQNFVSLSFSLSKISFFFFDEI